MTHTSHHIPSPHILAQKITAMDLWHLRLPVISRREHGIGGVGGNIEVVIVRLTSADGRCGFGEAAPWATFTGTAEASYAALDRYFRPHVVGAPVGTIAAIMHGVNACVVQCPEAKAALETALLDLAGRLSGVPVWALLGGKYRDSIPLSVSLANPDFAADLALMQRLWSEKLRIIKLKAGFRDHDFDLMRLERLRQDYPDLDLRVDYNQALAPSEALKRLYDVEQFKPSFIEQPVAAHHFNAMASLRTRLTTPLLADESIFNVQDMLRACSEKICDGVSVKIMKSGSLLQGRVISEIAQQAGLFAYGGDMFETGLAHMAGTHMIASAPHITHGCEFYQSTYYLEEDILSAPFPLHEGSVIVPNGPGLGCEVCTDRLKAFAIAATT